MSNNKPKLILLAIGALSIFVGTLIFVGPEFIKQLQRSDGEKFSAYFLFIELSILIGGSLFVKEKISIAQKVTLGSLILGTLFFLWGFTQVMSYDMTSYSIFFSIHLLVTVGMLFYYKKKEKDQKFIDDVDEEYKL